MGHQIKGPSDATWDYIGGDFSTNFPDVGHELDFISAFEVIEHMIDTDLFLQRIRSALAPGGWLLLSTPNINSLRNRITVPFGKYPAGLEFRNVIHHVRLYNPRVLVAHLTESGFTNAKVRGVGFLPFSRGLGASPISAALANALPSLCNDFLAVAQRPH